MSTFEVIRQKLEQFIKKYYTNELIKGAILFFATGLLYLLITLLVEYFLWLDTTGRTILFWAFVGVEAALFVRFICIPAAGLFRQQRGIGHEEASLIIGNHFPEVSDKLLNVIQLNQNRRESELLAASIDQKSSELQPIPFKSAINFKANVKYLKYAAIPVVVFVLFSLLGGKDIFSSSYERVVNYDVAYEPPAPFSFVVLNNELKAVENKNFVLKVRTQGDVVPENASINYNGETYYLQQRSPGLFEHTFAQPVNDIRFKLSGNKVSSREYILEVIETPSLLSFEMSLDYPAYTGRRDETLKSTGNATIPEGTKVEWRVKTKNTTDVLLKTSDTIFTFTGEDQRFNLNRGIYRKLDYAITTSNNELKDYENLSFTLGVIKDEYPDIDIQSRVDSTDSQTAYHLGRVSDDYGLTRLRLVYYPSGEEERSRELELEVGTTNFHQFVYSFPGPLILEEGVAYEYYFEVFDNDAIRRYKSSKSGVFSFRKLTQSELENEQLQNQEESIKGLDKSLEELQEQDKKLQELSKTQKEKNELNWNDKKKLENFIKRQQAQEEMMKNFSRELQENLENFEPENQENDPFKEELEKRLDENEQRLEENEELLKELERLQEKIQKEELTQKLEQLAKQNKNQEKNLEQLLELTKRYYVSKKAEKLAEEIFKLGEEQEELGKSSEEENTEEKQKELNEEFEKFKEEMDKLQEENQGLKQPMDIPQDKIGEKVVEQEQQKATEQLQQNSPQQASPSQQKAGQRMQQMGQQMQMQMQGAQMETIQEDVDMLRQILDNLVVFSFEQEDLMKEFRAIEYGNPVFGKKINVQNDLKQNFQHIDDSIFALSLRQPMISAQINESLTDVQYNLDKSLERLAENQMRQGISSQQYAITGANELAVLLSDLLGNMQDQMMNMSGSGQGQGKGQGQGQGFQLQDIIMSQDELNKKMGEGMKKSEEGQQGSSGGGKGEEGESEGQEGTGGDSQGQQGDNGRNGEGGEGGEGKDGNDGNGGNGSGEGEDGENGYSDEEMQGELFEIYKQQQQLRQQLQDKIKKEGLGGQAGDLLREMEGIEQQLLDRGFNERTLNRMLNLRYELLKLDKADLEQGQESRRESNTSRDGFTNEVMMDEEMIKKYFNTTEILNREALPLKNQYKEKVQDYFKNKND